MFVVRHRQIFFALATILVAGSLVAIFSLGMNLSIEFTGGSIVEVAYHEERPELAALITSVDSVGIENARLQPSEGNNLIVRTGPLSESEHALLLSALSLESTANFNELRFSNVGPSVGEELKSKALTSLAVVVVLIILFIAYAFRKVSKEVSSWKYGLVAIIALVHDVVVPTGIFVLLGHYFLNFQIDTLFVSALLAILGYSVNDTIVVFDRVRENLKEEGKRLSFPEVVGKSLRDTVARSINTSLTTLIVLLALFFLGGEATRHFALVLAVGVVAGTYSSIFLASPLLVAFHRGN